MPAVLLACLGFFVLTAAAQPALHTRVFHPAGSYPSLVSVSPNGTVLAKSGDSSVLTLFDGYNSRILSMPEQITYRIQQSRSSQIWSVCSQGVLLYHAGDWTVFSLPEIRAFLAAPTRSARQIALLPADINHVLILFPDKLLDFDATPRRTRELRRASTTGLGEFSEIQEGLDDSVWISGQYGVAHVPGPARRITKDSPWTEYLLPDTNTVNSLQRPFESAPGDLTLAALCSEEKYRAIVRFSEGKWSDYLIPEEKIRQAWRAWDGQTWGFSTISLFRAHLSKRDVGLQRVPVSGPQYDLAVETNGVFWVASGEGLIRYAPFLWRSPPELEDIQTSVNSILPGTGSNVWLTTPGGLVLQAGSSRRVYPWPEEIENLPPRQSSYRLANGRIMIESQNRPMVLNPETGIFERVPIPEGVRVHLVGELKDGVCAWFQHSEGTNQIDLRMFRDGEFQKLNLPDVELKEPDVLFVKEGSNSDVWICTGAELLRWRRNAGILEKHGPENGLRTDRIYALAEVAEGRVWCGTASRIYEFRGQKWESILSTEARVTDIVSSQASVWVSTLAGIHRFQENSWMVHGASEGLPNGAVYTLRIGPGDQLWAGTSRGAFLFHPDADLDPPKTLPPRLEEQQAPSAGEPTIVNFRGQDKWDYTLPSELLFSYRLDEGSWTPFSNVVSRTFQRLSAGNHFIDVLTMDRNGNKSPESSRIEFAVIVPWFNDPRLLSVLVMAGFVTVLLAALAVNKHFQLKRSYAEVEKIVAERTRELDRATQELVHSQKMRAIGTMAAGIAHDFNNILSIIKGSAQIIENNVGDKNKIRTRVGRIQLVVEQGSIIVKALLGLGKTGENQLSDCDIHQLLHHTRKLLGDRFPPTLQFQINASAELSLVRCAPDVLQQMLLNLIINAAEAMHNQGVIELTATQIRQLPPKLALEPESLPEAAEFVVLSVIDQGGGISAENLPRIFEPFFTTKAFSSRRGTGLGLSMVYELAKGLGYGLAVQTEVGQGSTFSIIIPTQPRPLSPPS